MFDEIHDLFIGGAEAVSSVNQQQNEVAALKGGVDFLHHFAVQAAIRFVHAGRIDKNNLASWALPFWLDVENSLDVHARGLRLFRNDGDFLADQRVEQRAFTGVGAADNRYKT